MNIIKIGFGALLVAFGVIAIKFGDRPLGNLGSGGGLVSKVFSHSYLNPKILKWQSTINKWVIGLVAIWFGLWLIFD